KPPNLPGSHRQSLFLVELLRYSITGLLLPVGAPFAVVPLLRYCRPPPQPISSQTRRPFLSRPSNPVAAETAPKLEVVAEPPVPDPSFCCYGLAAQPEVLVDIISCKFLPEASTGL
ncbi:hypothetical protein PIB30_032228, partial [Stylosanthes scabra]|nr:hypothetical protein [Stylosanthes scabra]